MTPVLTEHTGLPVASDEQLMTAAGRGDTRAFDEIVSRHQQSAWNFAYRFLGNAEEARDTVQEAFLRIWDAAPRYQPTAQFRTYLFRVISRLCLDSIRRKKPVNMIELPDAPDPSPSAAENLLSSEQREAVQRATMQLPDTQRIAVIMKYYENCSCKEIGEALVITEKAAERLLSRGRKRMKMLLMKWMNE